MNPIRGGMVQLSVRSEYEPNQGWHGSVISQKWVWPQSGVAWFSYQSEVSMNPIRGGMVQLSVKMSMNPIRGGMVQLSVRSEYEPNKRILMLLWAWSWGPYGRMTFTCFNLEAESSEIYMWSFKHYSMGVWTRAITECDNYPHHHFVTGSKTIGLYRNFNKGKDSGSTWWGSTKYVFS